MTVGRPFLQIPGPTNVPDRVLRAMDRPVIDHRAPEFATLTKELLPKLRRVFGTLEGAVVLYPSSGTGASEAALVNVLRAGDRVLSFSHGHFSNGLGQIARHLGFDVDEVQVPWGQTISPSEVEDRLTADVGPNRYQAILVVHNETSTGVVSDVGGIRGAMDSAGHEGLLIVDAVSSLGSMPVLFDEWRVDVCVAGSQKGLMLPPGLGIVCAGPRAVAVSEQGGSPRHFFDWRPILRDNAAGFFPYTPATLLLFGLREAMEMLVDEEGLDEVFARHERLASGVRAAVSAWPLPTQCEDPASASATLTAVVVPADLDSSEVVAVARERYGLGLGIGLGQLRGQVFRIGHLGALNELEVLATIAGTEMALAELGCELVIGSGVAASQQHFLADRVGRRSVPQASLTPA